MFVYHSLDNDRCLGARRIVSSLQKKQVIFALPSQVSALENINYYRNKSKSFESCWQAGTTNPNRKAFT